MKTQLLTILLSVGLLATLDASSTYAQHRTRITTTTKTRVTTKTKTRRTPSLYPGQFPESSERRLVDRDVEHQTAWGMKVMMNEIYARHGYIFKDRDLRKHFAKEKWYKGKERNMKNIKLTDTEIMNIAFIKEQQRNAKH